MSIYLSLWEAVDNRKRSKAGGHHLMGTADMEVCLNIQLSTCCKAASMLSLVHTTQTQTDVL